MEWILQLVDEIDDVISAVCHRWFGVYSRFDVPLSAMFVAAAAAAGIGAKAPPGPKSIKMPRWHPGPEIP